MEAAARPALGWDPPAQRCPGSLCPPRSMGREEGARRRLLPSRCRGNCPLCRLRGGQSCLAAEHTRVSGWRVQPGGRPPRRASGPGPGSPRRGAERTPALSRCRWGSHPEGQPGGDGPSARSAPGTLSPFPKGQAPGGETSFSIDPHSLQGAGSGSEGAVAAPGTGKGCPCHPTPPQCTGSASAHGRGPPGPGGLSHLNGQ